ncbi:MAG: spore germination protein GerW family protein [Roseiarcus sp.]
MGRLTDADADALQKDMSPMLTDLAETIGKKANATAVFGSPIVDGDRTVIPVASARFGLGAGDGLIAKGVGGGMTAKPLGFIVIDRNGVRFQKTPQPSMTALAFGVVLGLALAMRLSRPPRPRVAR